MALQDAGFAHYSIEGVDEGGSQAGEYCVQSQSPRQGEESAKSKEVVLSVVSYEEKAKSVSDSLDFFVLSSPVTLTTDYVKEEALPFYPYMTDEQRESCLRAFGVAQCNEAYDEVVAEIKRHLKNPSTLSVSSYVPNGVVVYDDDNNIYSCYADVKFEAQNDFGVSKSKSTSVVIDYTFVEEDFSGWINDVMILDVDYM